MYLDLMIHWEVRDVTIKEAGFFVVVTRPASYKTVGTMEAIGVVPLRVYEDSIGDCFTAFNCIFLGFHRGYQPIVKLKSSTLSSSVCNIKHKF